MAYEVRGKLKVDEIEIDIANAKPVEIATSLVCSTCHVSQETMEWLETNSSFNSEYGAIFYIGLEHVEEQEGVSDDLKACVAFARQYGVRYIQFDRDGPEYTSLQQFDW